LGIIIRLYTLIIFLICIKFKLVKASLTSGEEIEAERLIVFSHAVSLTLALCVMTICMFASLILVYF
jgi:hypothetical protein